VEAASGALATVAGLALACSTSPEKRAYHVRLDTGPTPAWLHGVSDSDVERIVRVLITPESKHHSRANRVDDFVFSNGLKAHEGPDPDPLGRHRSE
jgi:hypothetical protein